MYTMLGGFDYKCEVFSPKAKSHLKKKKSQKLILYWGVVDL